MVIFYLILQLSLSISLNLHAIDCNKFYAYQFDSDYTEYYYAKNKCPNLTQATSLIEYNREKALINKRQKNIDKKRGNPTLENPYLTFNDFNYNSGQYSQSKEHKYKKVTIFNENHNKTIYKDKNYFKTTGLLFVTDSQKSCNGKPCRYFSNGTLLDIDSVDGMRNHIEKELGKSVGESVVIVPMHSLYTSDGSCKLYPINNVKIRFSDCPKGNSCRHERIGFFHDVLCSTNDCIDPIISPEKDLCVLIPEKQPKNINPIKYAKIENENIERTYVSGYSPLMIHQYLIGQKGRTDLEVYDRIISETRFFKRDPRNESIFMHRGNTWTSSSGKGVYHVIDGQIRLTAMHIKGENIEMNGSYTSNTEEFNPTSEQANRAIDIGKVFKFLKKR